MALQLISSENKKEEPGGTGTRLGKKVTFVTV
jgi:hypothetical protein